MQNQLYPPVHMQHTINLLFSGSDTTTTASKAEGKQKMKNKMKSPANVFQRKILHLFNLIFGQDTTGKIFFFY